ncbi:MAG: metallophosphoesterase [Candidatus Pacearchaeota archaeon]
MRIESEVKYVGKCLLLTNDNERILVIGDLHLGYEESLNKAGIMVSRRMFKEIISELDRTFNFVGGNVNKIILLGDVKHNFGGILMQEWNDVLGLMDYLSKKCERIIIVRGNHDNILKPILRKRGLKMHNYYFWKDFCFLHGHEDFEAIWKKKGIGYLVVGHGHPALRLKEGVRSEKYKCFLTGRFRGKKMIIVPSFSEWYAGSDPREGEIILAWRINFENFEAGVVGERFEILNFGKLERIK